MKRSTIRQALRDLHGRDAEILEFEGEEPTGRSYRLRPEPGALDGMPTWARWFFRIAATVIAMPMILICLGAIGFGLLIVWAVLKSFF